MTHNSGTRLRCQRNTCRFSSGPATHCVWALSECMGRNKEGKGCCLISFCSKVAHSNFFWLAPKGGWLLEQIRDRSTKDWFCREAKQNFSALTDFFPLVLITKIFLTSKDGSQFFFKRLFPKDKRLLHTIAISWLYIYFCFSFASLFFQTHWITFYLSLFHHVSVFSIHTMYCLHRARMRPSSHVG